MKSQAIVLSKEDNVATAIVEVKAGTRVSVGVGKEEKEVMEVVTKEDVAFGFKFALRKIAKGEPVMKYGEIIGIASVDIEPGVMVHVHNTEGARGRGDLPR